MSDSDPVLTIENLSVTLPKGSDRKYAVEDVSFTVAANSGAGRSGTIRVRDRVVTVTQAGS